MPVLPELHYSNETSLRNALTTVTRQTIEAIEDFHAINKKFPIIMQPGEEISLAGMRSAIYSADYSIYSFEGDNQKIKLAKLKFLLARAIQKDLRNSLVTALNALEKLENQSDVLLQSAHLQTIKSILSVGEIYLTELNRQFACPAANCKLTPILKRYARRRVNENYPLSPALQTRVYKVVIPSALYPEFQSEGTVFLHRNPLVTLGKILLSVGQIVLCTLFEMMNFGIPMFSLFNIYYERKNSIMEDFGWKIKRDIPSEWIRGLAPSNADRENQLFKYPELKYPKRRRDENVTIYVIDARPQEDFIAKGTNYHLSNRYIGKYLNRHGHTVYFHSAQDAREYIRRHKEIKLFDAASGWNVNGWTQEQRTQTHENFITAGIYTQAPAPRPVAEEKISPPPQQPQIPDNDNDEPGSISVIPRSRLSLVKNIFVPGAQVVPLPPSVADSPEPVNQLRPGF
jgi:hypothetical protein